MFKQLPAYAGAIYYHPDYYQALASNNEGEPAAALYQHKTCTIFYPFLRRQIPTELVDKKLYDIESGYGYGGPACIKADLESVATFTMLFSDWASANGIVAEFIRFNPLTANHQYFNNYCLPELNRRTLCIELGTPELILANCASARRRNYHKAKRSGLKLLINHDFDCFVEIYGQTMQQLNAHEYYCFSDIYFAALKKMHPGNCQISVVTDNKDTPVAAAIFLADDVSMHYHLGGTTTAGRELQATSFCMLETAFKAAETGKQLMHLGGGLSLDENDSLFRFKRGFTPAINEFYIGKKVHQPDLYSEISQKWQQLYGAQPRQLLHYHQIPSERRNA